MYNRHFNLFITVNAACQAATLLLGISLSQALCSTTTALGVLKKALQKRKIEWDAGETGGPQARRLHLPLGEEGGPQILH